MRKVMLAMLALWRPGRRSSIAGSAPAAAYDYPWCVQGRELGVPGDCSYSTYGQCHGKRLRARTVLQCQSTRVAFGAAAAGAVTGVPALIRRVELADGASLSIRLRALRGPLYETARQGGSSGCGSTRSSQNS